MSRMDQPHKSIPRGPRRMGKGKVGERRERPGRDFKRGEYRARDDYRENYHRNDQHIRSRNEYAIVKPQRVDPRPSGILVKYADFQRAPSSVELTVADTLNKYSPPEDAVVPTLQNCNYHLFKYNEETKKQVELPLFNLNSYFIFGRDSDVSDIVIDEDTEDGDLVSKQHAALQFRKNKDTNGKNVTCYLIDLGSTNGIFLNGSHVELPKKRFIQLKDKDYFKLGDFDSILEFTVIQDHEK